MSEIKTTADETRETAATRPALTFKWLREQIMDPATPQEVVVSLLHSFRHLSEELHGVDAMLYDIAMFLMKRYRYLLGAFRPGITGQ